MMNCIFLFITTLALAQEKTDTLDLYSVPPKANISQFLFDNSFEIEYPLSSPFMVNQQMLYQLFNYDGQNSNGYEYVIYPFNVFYSFSKNGYTFWQNNNPLVMGFSYHLNRAMGWKKLDIFMDGQGGMYNEYKVEDEVFVPTDKKKFDWNAGVGVGYKVSKGNTIFIKSSVSFQNISPVGNRSFGGVNMKF
ncbi:MAG: hypothetical protein ACERKD_00470 [Prolixibacteraceae bacterium]